MISKYMLGLWVVYDYFIDLYQYGYYVIIVDGMMVCSVIYQLFVSMLYGVEEVICVVNVCLIVVVLELLEVFIEVIVCGMVLISSVKDGGVFMYLWQVRCVDMICVVIVKVMGEGV